MARLSYRRHRFPPTIIQHAIWLYLRFTLSYRDVEDLLAHRGVEIFYETVRRWVLKFGPLIARKLRQGRPRPSKRWHLDEMVVRIAGKRMYLWRAVDHEGEILDMLVQRRRDTQAALRLMRKLLKKQGFGGLPPQADPRAQAPNVRFYLLWWPGLTFPTINRHHHRPGRRHSKARPNFWRRSRVQLVNPANIAAYVVARIVRVQLSARTSAEFQFRLGANGFGMTPFTPARTSRRPEPDNMRKKRALWGDMK
jgi:putative transposase